MNEMQRAMLFQKYEKATLKKYKKKLRENGSLIFAVNLVATLHRDAEDAVDDVKRQGVRFACGKGCNHCCSTRVEVLPAEAFYIAKKLKENKPDDLPQLIEALEHHAVKAYGVRMEDYKIPCPLLKDGICSIYSYRPFMCRKFNSIDIEPCKEHLASIPEADALVTMTAAIGHSVGLAYEGKGLSSIPHEFGQALLVALTDEGALSAWSQGQEVFPRIPEMVAS
ncbi:YkgJ family cysteine cluster protein [Stutzerimonas stutzeri]|uniref:Putative Fe-S oxidoreductase n=1 Tax=Stutzerimonas stutzeri RCH2 TaxID=644801 RepID=L0GLD8_STUST|nr:YkgJ family cysteine cluster protein [Stutzerimonas stutzeri]AGA87548.1 putative Fe-S oxidoreductase [Stutzerimonas stutzeri RCH2]